jgi:hypothetical protein
MCLGCLTKPGQSRRMQKQETQDTSKIRTIKTQTKPGQSRGIQKQDNQDTYKIRTIKIQTKSGP